MIEIKNLVKKFDGHTALNGLNLNIKQGSIYGMVGVNGSGKTTAIKHLAGIYRQDAGTVTISNQPVYDNTNLKARMGYIPDDLFFFAGYNMKMQERFYKAMYKSWNGELYRHLQTMMQLDETRRLNRFSKGMQKQAAFVFAMSIIPDVLLLDEPIDGLDPIVRNMVFQLIIEAVSDRGMTVLLSSHNLKEMDGICDAVGILQGGEMIIERELDDLKADVHKVQVAFNGEADMSGLEILHQENRGAVKLLVIRGETDEVASKIKAMNPLIYDHLPLTLEEIFIYENAAFKRLNLKEVI